MPGGPAPSTLQRAMTLTIVVTCPVPCRKLGELELTPEDTTVVVAGPDGFRHELELPAVADMDAVCQWCVASDIAIGLLAVACVLRLRPS